MKIPLLLVLFLTHLALAIEPPNSFGYVLQANSLGKTKSDVIKILTDSQRDWLVLDASYSAEILWKKKELETIRRAKPGRKIIAYISIGEAEDYRAYWKKEWRHHGKLSAKVPSWLGKENPDWKGNFCVKYWQPEWQKIMLLVIADAMERGFDGIYLDIVDAFQTWEFDGKDWIDDRPNPETNQTYRHDMVNWVRTIAQRAREVNPDALVIPQNGSQLIENQEFLKTISAIGIEDLFSLGNAKQTSSHTQEILKHLKASTAVGKPTLVIEYPKNQKMQERSKKLAHENGLVWLITDRELKTLGSSGK